jgi:mono/diheme cytochrome c family protein
MCLAPLFAFGVSAAGPDYLAEVKPLLTRNCVPCHGSEQPKAGLRLDTASGARKGGESGAALRPGAPSESLMFRLLSGGHDGVDPMPYRRPPLGSAEIARIGAWIAAGAVAPADEAPGVFRHWAFVAPVRPPVPRAVEGTHPIDAFVLAGLEAAGMRHSPLAPPATRLRRVALDLVGLPPEPADIASFEADPSAESYRRRVESLLASRHHGERWGRWWLDAARYADSNGYSVDAPRSMWPYRDWVVEALNRDLPFDRFVTEQLAGDLIPGATVSQRTATGFHRNTQINQEGGVDPEQFRIESVFDRVATTGTVLLGLSVGCAQCHDHKFDPLTQRDYYGLFAFLNDQEEPTMEVPWTEVMTEDRKGRRPATTLVLAERATPRETRRYVKGDFTRPAEPVPPGTPAALPPMRGVAEGRRANRLDLAHWLVSPENPLLARVTVNRVWQVYFGRGLVETENDFGTQGTPPTHPELLDWLAVEFMESGWSLKHLHRRIVTSEAYQRSSKWRPDLADVDARNLMLARQTRLRLDAEWIRDVALVAGGLLDRTVGGPPVFPPQPEGLGAFTQNSRPWKASVGGERHRRGIYTSLQRSTLHPALAVFDAPDTFTACTRRLRSNTPLQALTLLNDAQFHEIATALGRRMSAAPGAVERRIADGFLRCTGRRPGAEETSRLAALHAAELGAGATEEAAWTAVGRVLLNLDETINRE